MTVRIRTAEPAAPHAPPPPDRRKWTFLPRTWWRRPAWWRSVQPVIPEQRAG